MRPHGQRRALAYHYVSAESLLPWLPPVGDEPMAALDGRGVMLAAGHDRDTANGVVDVMRPRLQADIIVEVQAPTG